MAVYFKLLATFSRLVKAINMWSRFSCQFSRYHSHFFIWMTVVTSSLIGLESLWPGSVRAYFNLSFWLLFWSISATIEVILSNKNS